jgi:histidine ammonia-lyase
MVYIIDNNGLTLEQIIKVVYNKIPIELDSSVKNKVINCRKIVEKLIESKKVIYGLNTGFGSLSKCVIDNRDAIKLSRNIVLSHAISVGDYLPLEHVRVGMLVRILALAKGHSGICLETLELLINMLNYDIIPLVPKFGSLACSGDLCLLSFVSLALSEGIDQNDTTDIYVNFQNEKMFAREAFAKVGLEKVLLQEKEGLALTNGSTFTAGIGVLCLNRIIKLYKHIKGSYAMSMEAFRGCTDALNENIHQARNHQEQIYFSQDILKMLNGSEFVNTSGNLQDAYSLRCATQQHCTLESLINYAIPILQNEVNAATDNPLIFGTIDDPQVYSGGNFAGYQLAELADYFKINLAKQCVMSDRRHFRMLDNGMSGLPSMLTIVAGLSSGFMITQYTTAGLVQRCQHYATPDSIMNVPTCGNQEDVNSNGFNAMLNLWEMLEHCEQIIAFEYLAATRAIWLLKQDKYKDKQLGIWTNMCYTSLIKHLEQTHNDHFIKPEFDRFLSKVISETFYNFTC